jgi:hypothetical protein
MDHNCDHGLTQSRARVALFDLIVSAAKPRVHDLTSTSYDMPVEVPQDLTVTQDNTWRVITADGVTLARGFRSNAAAWRWIDRRRHERS